MEPCQLSAIAADRDIITGFLNEDQSGERESGEIALHLIRGRRKRSISAQVKILGLRLVGRRWHRRPGPPKVRNDVKS